MGDSLSGLSCPSSLVGCAPSKCAETSAKGARQETLPAGAAAALPIGWGGGAGASGSQLALHSALCARHTCGRSGHLWAHSLLAFPINENTCESEGLGAGPWLRMDLSQTG